MAEATKNTQKSTAEKEYIEIDIMRLLRALWRRAWAIVLSVAILGGVFFWYASYMIKPTYTATAMLYVDNQDLTSKISLSTGELSAAQKLVNTFIVILKTRTTLEQVIEKADLSYTVEQLHGMVSAKAVDETEIFAVEVTSHDPQEAALIANTICEDVLPKRISSIITKSSVEPVDPAISPSSKSAPSVTMYTIVGMMLGFIGSAVVILIMELSNQYIRSEEYLLQTFEDIPVLAVIPDLEGGSSKSYHYYSSRSKGE